MNKKVSLIFFIIFLKWSSAKMFFFVFGKFFEFFSEYGKKSTFFPKIGGFCRQKRFSDFAQNWLRWGSDKIIFFKFGTFRIPIFPTRKKSNLLWKICIFFSKSLRASGTFFLNQNPYGHLALFFGGRVKKKVALIFLKIGSDEVQTRWRNQYLHISEKIFLWV